MSNGEWWQTQGQWEQYFAEHEAIQKKQETEKSIEEKGKQPPVMAVLKLKENENGFSSE